MPRLDRLSELQRKSSLAHPCLLNDTAPFTLPYKPLGDSRLALVTTAGIHVRGDAPFTGGDQSFRVIPSDTPPKEIVQSHASIGFDRTAFQRDINVVFPVDHVNDSSRAARSEVPAERISRSWAPNVHRMTDFSKTPVRRLPDD
jgi:D-proline reductase (dithiol) PrdB